jgi:hypothetical protein
LIEDDVRRKDVIRRLADRTRMDAEHIEEILEGGHPEGIPLEQVQEVRRLAGRLAGSKRYAHRRRSERIGCRETVPLQIYLEDGTLFDEGEAQLLDVSLTGARLGEIHSGTGVLPIEPYHLRITMGRTEVRAYPVRLVSSGTVELGVNFSPLGYMERSAVETVIGRAQRS